MSTLLFCEAVIACSVFVCIYPKSRIKYVLGPVLVIESVLLLLSRYGFIKSDLAMLDGVSFLLCAVVLYSFLYQGKQRQKQGKKKKKHHGKNSRRRKHPAGHQSVVEPVAPPQK